MRAKGILWDHQCAPGFGGVLLESAQQADSLRHDIQHFRAEEHSSAENMGGAMPFILFQDLFALLGSWNASLRRAFYICTSLWPNFVAVKL